MSEVFISYARSSAPQARAAAAALRELGYGVWYDDDLPSHRAYAEVIEEQLDAARATLVLWSAEAVASHWVRSEANRAREAGKMVQASVDGVRPPMPFDQIQCADLTGWTGEIGHPAWVRVAASVAELVGGRAARTRPQAPAPARVSAEGERRHLTVLACRLAGPAGIAAGLDPEQWRDIAARFQRAASEAVNRLGGHVAKVQGESLTAYFGYPQAREDAAERAVRAALAMLEAGADLAPLKMRVGVHAGVVVVAPGGAAEIDMFGEAPRLAAAIEAAAGPDEILISGAVRELVSGLFVVEEHGELEGERLYRTVRTGLVGRRARGFATGVATPFVGRGEDMAVLLGRWDRVQDGEGQVALLTGEAGIGKTRLIEEFGAHIRSEPHLWIECAGAALFATTPFFAVTQMLEQGLDWAGEADPAARVRRLEQALASTGLRLAEAVPLIAEMLGLAPGDAYAPLGLPPDQKRRRLLAALAAWVFSATAGQPLVLVIEDLQWADPSSLELLETLAAQGATAPLMLLLTARAEFRPPWPARGHHALIVLDRLSNRQARDLIGHAAAGLPRELVDRVAERADGVPLFAEELARLMREGEGGAHEIPATLLDSLAARLDRLGRARDTAQLGSVIGREFSYALIGAVSDAGEEALQADLARLADAELIYARGAPPEAIYRFKHALIQDAAYEALLKSARRDLHARVARCLTEQFPALAEAQPEALARHWTLAGEAGPAVAAWKRAGDAAYERHAFQEAGQAFRQALAVLAGEPETPERDARELELTSALGRVLQLTHGYAAQATLDAAARAKTLAEKSGSLSQLIREEARLWRGVITAGDYAGAAALADHILELAGGADQNPGRLLFAHNAQVQSRFYTGDLAGAEAHFALLSPLIDSDGQRQAPGNNVIGIGVASLTAWALGRSTLARERMNRARALAEGGQNPYDVAMALHFQGLLSALENDPPAAESAAAALLDLAQANGFSYAADLARGTLGWARAHHGAAGEGAVAAHKAWTGLSGAGARVGLTFGLTLAAEIHARAGDAARALEVFEDALTINPQERVFRPDTLLRRGDLRLALGQAGAAEADFLEALKLARAMQGRAWELRAAMRLTALARARGDGGGDFLAPLAAAGLDSPEWEEARGLTEADPAGAERG
jgi:class 3 adenylate cyclase